MTPRGASITLSTQVVNTALLLLEVQGEPLYDQTLAITSVFVVIYTVEFLLNLVVRGWAWYASYYISTILPSWSLDLLFSSFGCLRLPLCTLPSKAHWFFFSIC